MHKGVTYPTAFRRDLPTQIAFPNLWPDRCFVQLGNVAHLPGPRWADLPTTISEAGFVPDDQNLLVYVFLMDDGLFEARLQWTIEFLNHDPWQRNVLLFTDSAVIGQAMLVFDWQVIDPNYAYWKLNGTIPVSSCTLTKSGGFNLVSISDPVTFNGTAASWADNPDGWWNDH